MPVHPLPRGRLYLLVGIAVPRRACGPDLRRRRLRMRQLSRWFWLGLAATGFAAVTLVVVGAQAVAAHSAAARVTVRSTEYGKALFGPSGKVLYVFGADRGSTSHCYGVCATAWPPLLTKSAPIAGPGIQPKLLGTPRRNNGAPPAATNHHPP